MTDLEKLIAAVEAGTLNAFTCGATVDAYPADFPFDGEGLTLTTTLDAYRGSLDAALRLHEALLPGWRWITRNTSAGDVARDMCGEDDFGFANVWEAGEPNEGADYFFAFSATPARAWLLSILRALQEKGQ